MQKKFSIALAVLLPFVAYFLGFVHGSELSDSARPLPDLPTSEKTIDLSLFWKVWNTTLDKYVDAASVNEKQLLYGAMKGVVRSLGDPFSEFLTPKESEEFLDDLNGSLTGIGAEVGIRDGILTVISPLRGSPADRAGLLPGDHIFKIDGVLAADFSVFEAVKLIRGPIGTDVKLIIFRGDELEPREITITRDLVNIESVKSKVRKDGIAVVTVATFANNTAAEFTKVLNKLALQDLKGIVLDLRFNGGGYLDAAVDMTSKLLVTGAVVNIRERGLPDQVLKVSGTPILPDIPLVVLINQGSASASEIMAGALQDAKRATVVGEKSFGKGTVQELINNFSDGSTLRITVAKWFTPSGRDVTKDKIQPDIEVKMTNADYDAKRDPQLDKAVEILKGENNKT